MKGLFDSGIVDAGKPMHPLFLNHIPLCLAISLSPWSHW